MKFKRCTICSELFTIDQFYQGRGPCKACSKKRNTKYKNKQKANNPMTVRAKKQYDDIRRRAFKLGLKFDSEVFTPDYILELLESQTHCECCEIEFSHEYIGDNKKNPACPSIDRFIPENGYVLGNIVIICWRCNCLKRDGTAHEFYMLADWMSAKLAQDSSEFLTGDDIT